MVAPGEHWARQAGIDRPAVVGDLSLLSVDRLTLNHTTTESFNQRLVAEANPQYRDARLGEGANRCNRNPGLRRSTGSGRDHEALRPPGEQFLDAGLVVAHNLNLAPQLTQVLDQVVGEGIVVVDHQNVHQAQSGCLQASSTARNTAFALFTDSAYS